MTDRLGRLALAAAVGAAVFAGCGAGEPNLSVTEARTAYVDARTALLNAAQDPDVVTRMQAMEALAATLGPRAGATYMQGLSDANPTVRFAAAMAIGDSKYAPAKDKLLSLARRNTGERNKIAFCAIIYALHELGDDQYMPELPALLFDPEKEIRATAALVMGKMKEPSAARILKMLELEERSEVVLIQIKESLAMLDDTGAAMRLEGDAKMPSDAQIVAIDALGKLGTWRAVRVLQDLLAYDGSPLVRVAAAGALARAGEADDGGYSLCLAASLDPEGVMRKAVGPNRRVRPIETSSLQRLATISLGLMKRPESLEALRPLLGSEDGAIRVAASMAVLQIVSARYPELDAKAGQASAAQTRPAVPREQMPPVVTSAPAMPEDQSGVPEPAIPPPPATLPAPAGLHVAPARD